MDCVNSSPKSPCLQGISLAYQSLADFQKYIGVIETSSVILPHKLDVCTGLGIFPWDMVVGTIVGDWSDGRGKGMNEWIITITTILFTNL